MRIEKARCRDVSDCQECPFKMVWSIDVSWRGSRLNSASAYFFGEPLCCPELTTLVLSRLESEGSSERHLDSPLGNVWNFFLFCPGLLCDFYHPSFIILS